MWEPFPGLRRLHLHSTVQGVLLVSDVVLNPGTCFSHFDKCVVLLHQLSWSFFPFLCVGFSVVVIASYWF